MHDIGKIPYRLLSGLVGVDRPQLDAAIVGDRAYATNPAIGVPDDEIGFFAYHYAASNLAAAFAKPELLLVNALFPPGYRVDAIKAILGDLRGEAERYGSRIIGGHTARYKGLEAPLLAVTAVGPVTRARRPPTPGDRVLIVGEPGLEALHLLGMEVGLERLTPLPSALALQEAPGVKLMHDVSEGGVAGALLEVAYAYNVGIEVEPLQPPPGLPEGVDVLSAPSYGVLVVIAESVEPCRGVVEPCIDAGRVVDTEPLLRVGEEVLYEPPPNPLWRLYGEERTGDPVLARVKAAALELASIRGVEELIPEVGMNLAYAPPGAREVGDVAAIDGRIVRTTRGARVCGEPGYGASRHLARVLLSSARGGLPWRAAVNVKPSRGLLASLGRMGIEAVRVEPRGSCPVAEALERGVAARALWYGPAPGLEPSMVLLGESPEGVVELVRRVLANT